MESSPTCSTSRSSTSGRRTIRSRVPLSAGEFLTSSRPASSSVVVGCSIGTFCPTAVEPGESYHGRERYLYLQPTTLNVEEENQPPVGLG